MTLKIGPSHSVLRSSSEYFFAPNYDAAGLAGPRQVVSISLRPAAKARPLALPRTPRLRSVGRRSAVDETSSAPPSPKRLLLDLG